MIEFRTLQDIGDIKGKKVLVRVDWNVPMNNGEIEDDFRIQKSFPTLEFLKDRGAKVIIATHLDPDDASVEPLMKYVPDGMELLPNLRNDKREKENDESFARELAQKADLYVNEAFSASHRRHASIVGVPKLLPSFAGLRFAEEVERLEEAFHPEHPFLFILGGAKFDTKIPLVDKFLGIADMIAIFGANAKPAHEIYSSNPKVTFPLGDIGALDFADEANQALLKEKIDQAHFIVWNGPLGKYEDERYKEGTQKLALALAESGKKAIVGGADTIAALKEIDVLEKLFFVSTGGGAMLDFLATETLPGIEALKDSTAV